MLRCSEWWVKEQARRRRIPFSWIGGSYLFTAEHVAEIVRLFEVRPARAADSAALTSAVARPADASAGDSSAQLPRRDRAAARQGAASDSTAA